MLPGGLAVDEAVDAAKSVCNANPNAMLFVFYPQFHTSNEKQQVIHNRRKVEDKCNACLVELILAWGMRHCVALTFSF